MPSVMPDMACARTTEPASTGKNSIQEVVSAMTLEEKVSLLVGGGMNVPGMPMPGGNSAPTDAQKRVLGAECLTPTLLTAT